MTVKSKYIVENQTGMIIEVKQVLTPSSPQQDSQQFIGACRTCYCQSSRGAAA